MPDAWSGYESVPYTDSERSGPIPPFTLRDWDGFELLEPQRLAPSALGSILAVVFVSRINLISHNVSIKWF